MQIRDLNSVARRTLRLGTTAYSYFSLTAVAEFGHLPLDRLPNSLKVLLENVLRSCALGLADSEEVVALLSWQPRSAQRGVINFRPARILMQDFTGIPALVDLAALRDAVEVIGGNPALVNPSIPVDLVIDHSIMVDHFKQADALHRNMAQEFARNSERYGFLRWAQGAFQNLRVVPPGGGICHQVNLEYLAKVVCVAPQTEGIDLIYPDTLLGTDSHTTMVNALSVLGWGVGGIEAETAMLGRSVQVILPDVVGVRLEGQAVEGVSATDLVLTLTDRLRREGVVGAFVEFSGRGLDSLSLPDRATLANMAPEYGATCAFFPVDRETLRYLSATGRTASQVALVEAYARAQGWWREGAASKPLFSRLITIDLSSVTPCVAGPKRPQDRLALHQVKDSFVQTREPADKRLQTADISGKDDVITDGAVVIAAITSCTNTSNPTSMIAAGLLARAAVSRGLRTKPWVMTSLAPGSAVVSDYLSRLGLQSDLDALGFHLVAYGCAACVGNTAPLEPALSDAIRHNDLRVAAVLSGNRNFEGRINPMVKASYLASPVLVVAYALAGTVLIDLTSDPLGHDEEGRPVYLRDIWPAKAMIEEAMAGAITPCLFQRRYAKLFEGPNAWRSLPCPESLTYPWDQQSTYIRRPPFLDREPFSQNGSSPAITNARILLLLGDGITTDHISPAGPIGREGPAAAYLRERGVREPYFNAFGARRGNHEVMLRGAFANVRLRNQLVPDCLGGVTRHLPSGKVLDVFDAAARYHETKTPLMIVAGRDYGGGSSRDWAAKATALLGVKAVIAESFERIHRANLIAVGVLPLQFTEGISWRSLAIDGTEQLTVREGVDDLRPNALVTLSIERASGARLELPLFCRVETQAELEQLRCGGLLPLLFLELSGRPPAAAEAPNRERHPSEFDALRQHHS